MEKSEKPKDSLVLSNHLWGISVVKGDPKSIAKRNEKVLSSSLSINEYEALYHVLHDFDTRLQTLLRLRRYARKGMKQDASDLLVYPSSIAPLPGAEGSPTDEEEVVRNLIIGKGNVTFLDNFLVEMPIFRGSEIMTCIAQVLGVPHPASTVVGIAQNMLNLGALIGVDLNEKLTDTLSDRIIDQLKRSQIADTGIFQLFTADYISPSGIFALEAVQLATGKTDTASESGEGRHSSRRYQDQQLDQQQSLPPQQGAFNAKGWYSSVLFKEIGDKQAQAFVDALKKNLIVTGKFLFGDKTFFSGAWIADTLFEFGKEYHTPLVYKNAELIAQELLNKNYISHSSGAPTSFSRSRKLCYTFGTPLTNQYGFLLKQKRKRPHEWAARWVCVNNAEMRVYLSPERPAPKTVLHLQNSAVTTSGTRRFTVYTREKTVTFRAFSDDEAALWIALVRSFSMEVVRENIFLDAAGDPLRKIGDKLFSEFMDPSALHTKFRVGFSKESLLKSSVSFETGETKPTTHESRVIHASLVPRCPQDKDDSSSQLLAESGDSGLGKQSFKKEFFSLTTSLPCALVQTPEHVWVGNSAGDMWRFRFDEKDDPEPVPIKSHTQKVVSMIYLPPPPQSGDHGRKGTVWTGDSDGNIVIWCDESGRKLNTLNIGIANQPAQMGVVGDHLVACPGLVGGILGVNFFGYKEATSEVEREMSLRLGTNGHEGENISFIFPLRNTSGTSKAVGCWVVTSKNRIFYYNSGFLADFVRVKSLKKRSFSPISSGFAMGERRLYTGHINGEMCVWEVSESYLDATLFIRSQEAIRPITSLVVSPLLTTWTCSMETVQGKECCVHPLVQWGLGLTPYKKITFENGIENGLWASIQDNLLTGDCTLFVITSNFLVKGYTINKEPPNWSESKLPS